jgi:polar amino acid transport system substrate-binding protein
MNRPFRIAATMVAVGSLLAACGGPGTTSSPSGAMSEAPMSEAPMSEAPMSEAPATPIAGGLLDKILTAGTLVVSTDPAYPPQSEVTAEGDYEGFDIDVATEIAERLGVTVEWQTPPWEAITAGGWGGRWDISVGSMAITPERAEVIDFSSPYYFTPAQLAASTESGITSIDGLVGKTVCVGEATTYLQWLQGTLDFGPAGTPDPPPEGINVVTLPSDRDCAVQWRQGRHDFEGWLSSITTVELAVADGLPLITVGEPVFNEPLAVASDKGGPPTEDFIAWLDGELAAMHADGTLSGFSQTWFGADLTQD